MSVCACLCLQEQYSRKQWKVLLKVMVHCAKEAVKKNTDRAGQCAEEWQELLPKATKLYRQLCSGEAGSMAFAFVEVRMSLIVVCWQCSATTTEANARELNKLHRDSI